MCWTARLLELLRSLLARWRGEHRFGVTLFLEFSPRWLSWGTNAVLEESSVKISELNWSSFDSVSYDDDLLLSVRAGRVALLIRGRNAWHSTWVEHYLRNATMYTDAASAKGGAESRRERGSVFYVVEAPALQLRGAVSNVVVCDSHPDNPFGRFVGFGGEVHPSRLGRWIGGLFPGVSVRDAVSAFAHDSGFWKGPTPSQHSLRLGDLSPEVDLSRRSGKLANFSSEAVGVDYLLRWKPSLAGHRYTRRGVNAVERNWQQTLDVAGVAPDSVDSETSARLRRYRDETLMAIPHSAWSKRKQEESRERLRVLSSALEAWSTALERVAELEEEIELEEDEFAAAKEARMHPAKTSEDMRRQRERMEAAATRMQDLESAVEEARAVAERHEAEYLAYSVASWKRDGGPS